MAVRGFGNRANDLLDMVIRGFSNQGQDVITPFNASPVDRRRTPLQYEMNRPEVMISQPGGREMVTIANGLQTSASPVPSIRNAVKQATSAAGERQVSRMSAQKFPIAEDEQKIDANRLISGREFPQGSGVALTPQQAEMASRKPFSMTAESLAEDAAKAVEAGAAESSDPTVMEGIKNYFGSRENMIRLALAFNSMRLTPDAGLAAALTAEQKDLRAQKLLTTRANATLNALRQAGVPEKDLQVLANDPELLRKYAVEFFKKQLGTVPAEQQAFENLIADMSPDDQEKARRIKAGLDPRAGSQFALGLEELFARAAAQAGGSEAGKSEQEKKALQVQNDKTWKIWQTAISSLEESLGNTATGRVVGLLPAITSNQQIADQSIAIMAPVLKNIFRESGEGVFTDKDQQILIDMIPDRGANPDTVAYAIKMINDIVAAKLNQQIQVEIVPNRSSTPNVLRFDAQGNPIK